MPLQCDFTFILGTFLFIGISLVIIYSNLFKCSGSLMSCSDLLRSGSDSYNDDIINLKYDYCINVSQIILNPSINCTEYSCGKFCINRNDTYNKDVLSNPDALYIGICFMVMPYASAIVILMILCIYNTINAGYKRIILKNKSREIVPMTSRIL